MADNDAYFFDNTTYFFELPLDRILDKVALVGRAEDFAWMSFSDQQLRAWLDQATDYLKRMVALAIASKLLSTATLGEASHSTRFDGFFSNLSVRLPIPILEMVDQLGNFNNTTSNESWKLLALNSRVLQLICYAGDPTEHCFTSLWSDFMMKSLEDWFPLDVLLNLPVIITNGEREQSVRPPAELDLDDEEMCEDFASFCASGVTKGSRDEFLGRGLIWRSRKLDKLPDGEDKIALEDAVRKTFGLELRIEPKITHDLLEMASVAAGIYTRKYQEQIGRTCSMATFTLLSGHGSPSQPMTFVRMRRGHRGSCLRQGLSC
jgi:hypothetical protein